ncbi:MAG: TetR/AcrR family transcriptional regulator [Lachnospiraceae bacterium]|nr:TetR/AcrR family transcriptional regulator [Lachnospiraceae bacterium]
MSELTATQEKIHQVAKQHFLREGFQKASLRQIVSEAGYTLGAFYGYYQSKEDLFDALVKDTAEGIVKMISAMGDRSDALQPEQRKQQMSALFAGGLPGLLDYLLEHRDETYLLLRCSEGTRYEHFLSGLMQRNLASARQMSGSKLPMHPIAANLLERSYFALLGDAALSDASKEDIATSMQDIQDFYAAGLLGLMKREEKR